MRVLKGLASHGLPCGCRVGIYETYAGPIVGIIDYRADECPQPQHRPGLIVPAPPPPHHHVVEVAPDVIWR